MHKIKVLMCGPSVSAIGGGPTHMRSLLAPGLMDRCELIHFATGSRGRESPAADEALTARVLRLITSPLMLAVTIRRRRTQIVHLNSVMDHRAFWRDSVYGAISKALGCKVVLQMHGGALGDLVRYPVLRRAARWGLAVPDAVVLLANKEKRDFMEEGITQRLFVIPNGIDIGPYQAISRIHSGRVHRLVYMGRLVRSKGIFEAIEAVAHLRADPEFRNLELVIAGTGPDQREIEIAIQRNGLSDRIRLIGPVEGDAKIRFLQDADLFVFPTYHREGLPYTVLESLAAGTPVIATRVAGIPDVVVDGVHGRLIEPRDPGQVVAAVRELGASNAKLRAMSVECRTWAAERFSLDRLARRLEEVYAALDEPERMPNIAAG